MKTFLDRFASVLRRKGGRSTPLGVKALRLAWLGVAASRLARRRCTLAGGPCPPRHLQTALRFLVLSAILLGGFLQEARAEESLLPDFAKAYRREKKELEQSLQVLRHTLQDLQRDSQSRKLEVEGKIQRLLRQATSLRRESQGAEEEIQRLQGQALQGKDATGLLDGVLRLGSQRLREEKPGWRRKGQAEPPLAELFEATSGLLAERSKLQREKGDIFDPFGVEREGELFWWGGIAAWGRIQGDLYLLERLPEGRIQAFPTPPDAQATLRAFSDTQRGSLLPFLLFDPLKKPKPAVKSKGFLATMEAGGPIAWILLALAVFGGILLVERAATLLGLRLGSKARWDGLLRQIQDPRQTIHADAFAGMGLSTPLLAAIWTSPHRQREKMEEAASDALLAQRPRLERSTALLGVLVTVAPLLGLLGTVTGMIATFEVITLHGTGNPALLSQGISEALITTEIGLAVAIPLLLAKSFFLRWSDHLLETSQIRALQLIQILENETPPHSRPASNPPSLASEDPAPPASKGTS